MAISFIDIDIKNRLRILVSILFIEYLIIFFSGVSFFNLNGNSFFSLGIDPFFWMVYLFQLPQAILNNTWLSILCDASILLCFILLIYDPFRNKIAAILFLLLLVFYMTVMGLIGTRNYMTGFFLVLFPFLFSTEKNRQISFEVLRYFLLFFYFAAAIIKIQQHHIYDIHYFSNILINQFTPYYLENNVSLRTTANLYLIAHSGISRMLFLSGTLLEFISIVGFFTKRFDRYLACIILLFHFANWFIMDIAPVGHIAFICTLFFSQKFSWKAA